MTPEQEERGLELAMQYVVQVKDGTVPNLICLTTLNELSNVVGSINMWPLLTRARETYDLLTP